MKSNVDFSTKDVIQLELDDNTTFTFAMKSDSFDKERLLPEFAINGEVLQCVGIDDELTKEFCGAICVLLAYVKLQVVLSD